MVVRRKGFVAHARVALDVATFVLASARRLLDHALEALIEHKRNQTKKVNVPALPLKGGHVERSGGRQPHERIVLAEVVLGSQARERVRVEIGQAAHVVVVAVVGLERLADAEETVAAEGLERFKDSHVAHVGCEKLDGQEPFDPVFDVGVFVGQRQGGFGPRESALVLILVFHSFPTSASVIDPHMTARAACPRPGTDLPTPLHLQWWTFLKYRGCCFLR